MKGSWLFGLALAGGLLWNSSCFAESARVLLIGQSYWLTGGGAASILTALVRAKGCDPVLVQYQRCTPRIMHHLSMMEQGRQAELGPKERTEEYRKSCQQARADLQRRLTEGTWDHVVFHGLSVDPLAPNPIQRFDLLIHAIRKSTPAERLCIDMTWPRLKTDFSTHKRVYRHLARKHGIRLAPTGLAFERVYQQRRDIALLQSATDAHPSVRGQYLHCCVVYAAMTGKSPVGLPAKVDSVDTVTREAVDIPPDVAKYLQETAWSVVQAEQDLARSADYGRLE